MTALGEFRDGRRPNDPSAHIRVSRFDHLICTIPFLLPVLLWIGGMTTDGCLRASLSHYYYLPFWGDLFVGLLFIIGAALIVHHGPSGFETYGSTGAGIGAMGVALFPVETSGCAADSYLSRPLTTMTHSGPITEGYTLFDGVGSLHTLCAAVLVLYLGFYCLLVLSPEGLRIAKPCAIVILLCGILMYMETLLSPVAAELWDAYTLTFYVETTALWAFGLAWGMRLRG